VTVTPTALAAMLQPAPAVGTCSCRPTAVCPQHRDQYPAGPVTCRARCGEPLDPILWPDGLHLGCTDPAPIPTQLTITQLAAPASTFAAPAGPKKHPLKAELTEIIRWFENSSPRSLQAAIGPSEIGVDCLRRIAYKVTGVPVANTDGDPWFAIIGTAVHDWLAEAIDTYQKAVLGRGKDNPRFHLEKRVTITADENGVSGSTDAFDIDHGRVIDHKVVGNDNLKKYRDNGPSNQYRIQAHLYGKGWEDAGYQVNEVVIVFYPRSNYLDQMHVWSEPYDRQVALAALSRLDTVRQMAAVLPIGLIPPTTDMAGCTWCDFYRPGGPADASGCPGPQDPGTSR
jgi:hypothetical protein